MSEGGRQGSGERFEVAIIGAGIAGASLAYFLTTRGVRDVVVLEREAHAGFHASGRSAGSLVELDAQGDIRRLKAIGARFLRNPPRGFADNPLLECAGVLKLFVEPQWSELCRNAEALRAEGLAFELLEPARAADLLGGRLDPTRFDGAALLADDGYIDVHELLSSYIAHARRAGVEFRFRSEVKSVLGDGRRCRGVRTEVATVEARWTVNAGGAWVGEIASAAGAASIGFSPMRRCIATFAAPAGTNPGQWPMVWSDPHRFYFRSDPMGLLFCPMDEVLAPPSDPLPDDVAIAAGLERLRAVAPQLVPRTLGRRWAGLRTFSPDRLPVVGEDPLLPGFFWLAGQGGCGMETSPALGEIAAALIAEGRCESFDAGRLSPARFG